MIILLIVLNHKKKKEKGFLLGIMAMLWPDKLRGAFQEGKFQECSSLSRDVHGGKKHKKKYMQKTKGKDKEREGQFWKGKYQDRGIEGGNFKG